MPKFDFNKVKESPAVNAAEQEIVEGFDELNHGITSATEQNQPYTVLPKTEPPVPPVQPEGGKFDNEPTKGVQANMPISLYNRMKQLKFTTDQTFQSMFQEAMDLWLDVQEGKMKVQKVE
jgi:hypothetical protein